jgi:membrane-associated PAP2 superfamily phosphatase
MQPIPPLKHIFCKPVKGLKTSKSITALDRKSDSFFIASQLIGLFVSACFLIFIYPNTGLDQILIAPYFDASAQRFTLKHDHFLEQFMHLGLKYCMVVVAISSLVIALRANIKAPFMESFFVRTKNMVVNPYFLAFIGMLASTTTVSIFKSTSMHGCPFDLTHYGGDLPLLPLFGYLPTDVKAGHCFPGGHASGGFALMAFYFAFKDIKPNFARAILFFSLFVGFVMGWAQMMRGEHFLSHNLWSAWLVWLVLFVMFTAKTVIEKNSR